MGRWTASRWPAHRTSASVSWTSLAVLVSPLTSPGARTLSSGSVPTGFPCHPPVPLESPFLGPLPAPALQASAHFLPAAFSICYPLQLPSAHPAELPPSHRGHQQPRSEHSTTNRGLRTGSDPLTAPRPEASGPGASRAVLPPEAPGPIFLWLLQPLLLPGGPSLPVPPLATGPSLLCVSQGYL